MQKKSRSRSKDKKDKSKQTEKSKNKGEGVKLYLSNLGSNTTEKRVMEEFKRYGDVIDLNIKRKNGKSNYYGYVLMKSKTSAEQATNHISKQ